jgi:hypothetical protein
LWNHLPILQAVQATWNSSHIDHHRYESTHVLLILASRNPRSWNSRMRQAKIPSFWYHFRITQEKGLLNPANHLHRHILFRVAMASHAWNHQQPEILTRPIADLQMFVHLAHQSMRHRPTTYSYHSTLFAELPEIPCHHCEASALDANPTFLP